jgi:hypothetical protein
VAGAMADIAQAVGGVAEVDAAVAKENAIT